MVLIGAGARRQDRLEMRRLRTSAHLVWRDHGRQRGAGERGASRSRAGRGASRTLAGRGLLPVVLVVLVSVLLPMLAGAGVLTLLDALPARGLRSSGSPSSADPLPAGDATGATDVPPFPSSDAGPGDSSADRGGVAGDVAALAPWTVPEVGSRLHGSRFGAVDGFLVFRGNPTRTFYGVGPVPRDPRVAWSAPDERLCSIEGDLDDGGRIWCGIGWTGQVVLTDRGGDGRRDVEVMVGGYDGAVHFFDGATGARTRPAFVTGAMVKGTETIDPDGFPLVYVGSRDGFLRAVAMDRDVPTELWRLGRHPQGVWNNDWDANPTVLDDVLYAGGEDSWFRMWRLHRSYGPDGLVTVDPELLVEVPAFDDALFARLGDTNVSIESSPAITADRVYWVNSGGRVMGIDRQAALAGRTIVTFDHWVGDDADASIVVDRDGMLIVAVEEERRLPAAEGMGQLIKLDPARRGDPVVWRLDVPADPVALRADPETPGGIWATPAIFGDHLYVPTHAGELLVVDHRDGRVVWRERLGGPLWSSPAVVEEPGGAPWLVVGTCATAGLRGYLLEDPAAPELQWTVALPGCVEATPVVWRGSIYVGTRDGRLHAVR
jgi:outer membrane protein assembly factor BamB